MADGASLPSASSNKPLITPLTLVGSGFSTAVPSSVEATDDVIPPAHTHRTLVLCFDGTGDQFDTDVSSPGILPLSLLMMHYPRTRTSSSSFPCLRRMTLPNRWFTTRSVVRYMGTDVSLTRWFTSVGWNWHLHYSSNRNSVHGQAIENHRHDAWESPRCTCNG